MLTIPTEPIGSIPRPLELIEAVALAAGFDEYLKKPIDPAELTASVLRFTPPGRGHSDA